MTNARDEEILAEIARLIEASGAVEYVRMTECQTTEDRGIDVRTMCFVEPLNWSDQDLWSDESYRRVNFAIRVIARDEDPVRRLRVADDASAKIQDTVDGRCLLGSTLVGQTRINRGRYAGGAVPVCQWILEGYFTVLTEGVTGRDTSDSIDYLE